jgi:hypothetical protein
MYPRIRGEAARSTLSVLLENSAGVNMAHVDDVLDFFETIAFLAKRQPGMPRIK